MITRDQIDSVQFAATRFKEGYDQNEVDTFLDQVKETLVALEKQVAGLTRDNESLRRRNLNLSSAPTGPLPVIPAAAPQLPEPSRILQLAEETAQKHIKEAQSEADRITREASGKGARAVEEAQQAAAKTLAEAEEKAAAIINEGYAEKAQRLRDIEAEHSQVQASVNRLTQQRDRIVTALREALNSTAGSQ